MKAIGSNMRFSSGSIDQPGKGIARALHGTWSAGPQPFSEADTWMLVGANPTISMWGGIPQYDPAKRLRDAKANGMKLIVIDPRRTEAAANADLFLQPKPGEDPTILAGILRVILTEGLHDDDVRRRRGGGLRRAASRPSSRSRRSTSSGAPTCRPARWSAAARMFAAGRRGIVTAGTGPNMAPRGTLTEYLIACIQTVCGRWLRAGERVPNPYVLLPRAGRQGAGRPARCRRGASASSCACATSATTPAACPTAALADEILVEGDGRVRALISLGGNPMAAWPDQLKTYEAMQALDLNVTLDIKMSATAKLADYVIAPKLSLEVAEHHACPTRRSGATAPRPRATPSPTRSTRRRSSSRRTAARSSRSGSSSTAWPSAWASSSRFAGVEVSMTEQPPTTDELLDVMTRNGPHPARRGEAPSPRPHLRRPLDRGAARRNRAGRTASTSATR